jgi:hypothetical protein
VKHFNENEEPRRILNVVSFTRGRSLLIFGNWSNIYLSTVTYKLDLLSNVFRSKSYHESFVI